MKKFSTYTKLHRLIAAAAIVVIIIAVILQGSSAAPLLSYAASYTDVLTDLQKDESFDMSEYPSNSTDYSLSVIQIAESEDGELFIYVYQPYTGSTYDLTATSINMSLFKWDTTGTTVGNESASYLNYSLTQISRYGVFAKYIVNGFTVSTDEIRYYDISSIYRTYYTKIDGEETGDNTTGELAIEVAQCWAVGEIDGETYYDMQKTEVVTVQSYAGYIRYWTGSPFNYFTVTNNYVDSHFVAFSCDYDIEDLYEADISFYTQSYWYYSTVGLLTNSESYDYEDIDTTYYDNPLTIDCGDSASYGSIGYLGVFDRTTYTWDRICTVNDFIEDLDDDNATYDSDFIDTISNMQWVVRFYETEFTYTVNTNDYGYTYTSIYSTRVTDITILRLKFLCDGQVYNLGTVSNKITGSTDPDVTVGHNDSDSLKDLLKKILMIAALVLVCVLFAPLLPYLAKLIVWVISLPFKLISAIVQAIKKSSDKPKKE